MITGWWHLLVLLVQYCSKSIHMAEQYTSHERCSPCSPCHAHAVPSTGQVRSGFTTLYDANGHGTHCAGIATALFNNGGIVGVAPNAEVVSARVLDSAGSGIIASVISGINW